VFWQAHDPTTLNRQGADEGTSYRSIILYRDKKKQLKRKNQNSPRRKISRNPIVTEIVPLKKFYKAEDYHQEYYDNQFPIALLPGRHRAQARKAGEGKK
jgi:peptide-methionine (S)-S-oxide reductase